MRVAGVQIEKDSKGRPTFARFNLKKHGNLINPVLQKIGAIEEDEFDKEFKNGLSPSEFKNEMKQHLKKYFV